METNESIETRKLKEKCVCSKNMWRKKAKNILEFILFFRKFHCHYIKLYSEERI